MYVIYLATEILNKTLNCVVYKVLKQFTTLFHIRGKIELQIGQYGII